MSSKIDLTAIITPKPGKAERFLDLFGKIAKAVENEPGTLIYEIRRGLPAKNGGKEQLVVREVYADAAGEAAHMQSNEVKTLMAELEAGTLVENIDVIFTGESTSARPKL